MKIKEQLESENTANNEYQVSKKNLESYLSDPEIMEELTLAARNGVKLTENDKLHIIQNILKLRNQDSIDEF